MDALVNKVPLALDTAGRVTSREIAMVDSGHSTEAERIALAVDQGVMESAVDAIHSGLKTAYADTSDPELQKTLTGPLALISGLDRRAEPRAHARGQPRARRHRRDALRQGRHLQRRRAADAAGPRARPPARASASIACAPSRAAPTSSSASASRSAAYLFLAFFTRA